MEEQDRWASGGRSGQFDSSSSPTVSACPRGTSCCEQYLCETSRVGTTHLPATLWQGQRIEREADERLDPVSWHGTYNNSSWWECWQWQGRERNSSPETPHQTLAYNCKSSTYVLANGTAACQWIQTSQDFGATGSAGSTAHSFRNGSHCEIEVLASHYEGISYTHAEGQSVGTSSRHEFVKQRLLDWSWWEMDEIYSGGSTRSTSGSTTGIALGTTSWNPGQCLHSSVWWSTRRGGSQSGGWSRTPSGELGAHWSGWSSAMGSKEEVPHEEAVDSRFRRCHSEDANAVQQSGGVLSGGSPGQCMGYLGTSSSKEAGNRGKTADHRGSTVHGSHSATWGAVQEHREEHGGSEGIGIKRRRGCSRRRGVGQPTSFIGRSEEEPTTMERGSEEGVRLFDRLWGDQTNRVKGVCRASGAVWSGGVNSDYAGCGEEATIETQSQSGSMRQPCPRGNRMHHCRRSGYGGGKDLGVTCCSQGPHHPHLRYQNSFPPGSKKIDTRTGYDPDTTSNLERSPALTTTRRKVGGGKGNVRTDRKSEGLGRL